MRWSGACEKSILEKSVVNSRESVKGNIDNNWLINEAWMKSLTKKHVRWRSVGTRTNHNMGIDNAWDKFAAKRNAHSRGSAKGNIDTNWRITKAWLLNLTKKHARQRGVGTRIIGNMEIEHAWEKFVAKKNTWPKGPGKRGNSGTRIVDNMGKRSINNRRISGAWLLTATKKHGRWRGVGTTINDGMRIIGNTGNFETWIKSVAKKNIRSRGRACNWTPHFAVCAGDGGDMAAPELVAEACLEVRNRPHRDAARAGMRCRKIPELARSPSR